jgi:hypothetical protein
MMRSARSVLLVPAIVVLAWAVPAEAQTTPPALTLGVGYQMLHIPDNTSRLGVNLDVSAPRSDLWSIVGEFGLSHFDEEDDVAGSADIFHFGGGVRLNRPLAQSVSGFVQAIAGVEVARGESDTDAAFMLQPGAGVVATMSERWGLFAQADFRPVFFSEEVDEQARLVVGIRVTMR